MKIILIIASFLVLTAYADLAAQRAQLIKTQTECETKLGEPKNLIKKMVLGEDIGDRQKAGKMAICINHGKGHMNEAGELIPDKFKAHVEELVEDEDQRKKIIDTCGQIKGSTPEEGALNYMKCMQDNLPRATAKDFD
ncbi:unnamed protein product [Psylliodes chrysocephalus]|uniref:Uncharacterized protein n=1 Tax=Psylliodes chrysocephalus TaxID=3402493 RepID=A0A9P0G516_9CUCU|nr:unnamed protein product [Psylliodes chrysocephala]